MHFSTYYTIFILIYGVNVLFYSNHVFFIKNAALGLYP